MDEFENHESGGLLDALKDPRGLVERRGRWMLVTLIVGLGMTSLFVALRAPRYLAKATVLVTSQQIPEDFVRPTIEENPFQTINAMVGAILSRDRIAELVQKHDLYPDLRGRYTLEELVLIMREQIEIAPEEGIGAPSRFDSARMYGVSFLADRAQVAADVANDLAGLFIAESIRERNQQARLTTAFLRRGLEGAESELREQNRKITEFKEAHRGELPAELNANLGRLERLQQQRQSLALQITEAHTRLAMLSGGAEDPTSPEARLAALRTRLDEELAVRTDEHPNVTSLKRQVAVLEAEIKASGEAPDSAPPASRAALAAAARRTLTELQKQLSDTEKQLQQLDQRVEHTPARQEELEALEERATVLRENYRQFLRKVQEAELAQSLEAAQQGERVSVVDWATPPTSPTRERWKYFAAGLVASLGLALGVGMLLELSDPVLVGTAQVELLSELPVLGSVPHIA